jgi:hypothetical protein
MEDMLVQIWLLCFLSFIVGFSIGWTIGNLLSSFRIEKLINSVYDNK